MVPIGGIERDGELIKGKGFFVSIINQKKIEPCENQFSVDGQISLQGPFDRCRYFRIPFFDPQLFRQGQSGPGVLPLNVHRPSMDSPF